ncbi:unnamed protein product [Thlaspi arvense]|uniref:Uncharacterized protein n=1 Tax=Thlaspi arvense TaxID=13288 RepID=A0AAU9RY59_THLAR|nr:unnamed protein product [Thlaspi arvense]
MHDLKMGKWSATVVLMMLVIVAAVTVEAKQKKKIGLSVFLNGQIQNIVAMTTIIVFKTAKSNVVAQTHLMVSLPLHEAGISRRSWNA